MLKKINPTKTNAWSKLIAHYSVLKNKKMNDFFTEDENRANKYSIETPNIFLDYSKNIVTEKTMELLFELADECQIYDAVELLFSGEKINETENRAVLHTALRNISDTPVYLNNIDIMPQIKQALAQMKDFSDKIRSGEWIGYTGTKIKNIVNIGIGGSDLGPAMVSGALKHYGMKGLSVHYVSNIDSTHIVETLKGLKPKETLFMIASKTFTTQETMTNAYTARKWFLDEAKDEEFIKKHFIALSTNEQEVIKFGIDKDNIFKFWNFVGGRYSVFSSIGLSVMCYIGYDNFYELLSGAHEMDNHFRNSKPKNNIPIVLALLGIWYNNFFNSQTEVILPYDQYLNRFSAYFQQGNMESNGKSVDRNGDIINYQTGPVIWGEVGTNGQHAFYQLIHQGTKLIPADFLAPCTSLNPIGDHHEKLLSNFFAQTEALMKGKSKEEVENELSNIDLNQEEIDKLLPFKVFSGNKPTNSILYKKLTPKVLGSLISMYELKIFVQGVIWNIYSFDQWGVELGKQLAGKILPELKNQEKVMNHDSSTNNLINKYKEWR